MNKAGFKNSFREGHGFTRCGKSPISSRFDGARLSRGPRNARFWRSGVEERREVLYFCHPEPSVAELARRGRARDLQFSGFSAPSSAVPLGAAKDVGFSP